MNWDLFNFIEAAALYAANKPRPQPTTNLDAPIDISSDNNSDDDDDGSASLPPRSAPTVSLPAGTTIAEQKGSESAAITARMENGTTISTVKVI